MKKKVDVFERYQRKFVSKLETAQRKCKINPTYGIGTAKCNTLGIPTPSKLHKNTLRDIKHLKRQAEREYNIQEEILATWRKYRHLHHDADVMSERELKKHARDLSNSIYDFPVLWTGHRTKASVGMKSNERTKEHFYPRQWAGEIALDYFLTHPNIAPEELRVFVDVFRQVHYTTAEENRNLMKYQKEHGGHNWRESYAAACSELIQEEDRGPIRTLEDAWSLLEQLA